MTDPALGSWEDDPAERPEAPADAPDLSAALASLSSFQALTQQADAKANMLLAVQIGLGAVIATRLPELSRPPSGGWLTAAVRLTAVTYLLAFFATGYQLVQVMRPRIAEGRGLARFVPGVGIPPAAPAGDRGRVEAVWTVAHEVALIAERKNRHIGLALSWTCAMVVLAVLWMTLSVAF